MNWKNIKWVTLIPAVFGAIKLILQPFGVDFSHITDDQVNQFANGVAGVAVVIGIIVDHFGTAKGAAANGIVPQRFPNDGPAV